MRSVGTSAGAFKRRESGTDMQRMSSPGAASQARDVSDPVAEASDLVLLVDDERLLLRSLRRILQADGHDTALAESLEQAEPLLVDPNLSVVLLDLFLGSTNGLDLLERLKLERPEVEGLLANARVVALFSHVYGDRVHLHPVVLFHPAYGDGGVESSGIGKDDFWHLAAPLQLS